MRVGLEFDHRPVTAGARHEFGVGAGLLVSPAVDDVVNRAMAKAPEGAAAYFIKSSVWADTPLDRVIVAATRLAEVAHEETRRRFAHIQQRWLDEIAKDVGPGLAKAVLYMGDGLYFNAMLSIGPAATPAETAADVESLLAALERLRG